MQETEPKTPSCRGLLTGAIILLLNNVIVAFYFFFIIKNVGVERQPLIQLNRPNKGLFRNSKLIRLTTRGSNSPSISTSPKSY